MNNNMLNERYDEIKSLLRKSRMLVEQDTQINVAKDLEKRVAQDNEYETDKSDLDITTDDKVAFQETMDEFVEEVSDLVDFNVLNVYPNNVEWSGKVIDEDLEFIFTIGEDSGIYINGQMVKVDQDFLDMINKLQQFYQKFKSKWGKVLASRKKTKESPM